MIAMPRYVEVTILLRARILALIEDHPEILTMPPGDLFQIREFEFEDLDPTLEQAYDALTAARRIWKLKQQDPETIQ